MNIKVKREERFQAYTIEIYINCQEAQADLEHCLQKWGSKCAASLASAHALQDLRKAAFEVR